MQGKRNPSEDRALPVRSATDPQRVSYFIGEAERRTKHVLGRRRATPGKSCDPATDACPRTAGLVRASFCTISLPERRSILLLNTARDMFLG